MPPPPHTTPAPAVGLAQTTAAAAATEAIWDCTDSEAVEQVMATQQEVAALLQAQAKATCELSALKDSAQAELADLQAGAWRLQLFTELEHMRGQLEQLGLMDAGGSDTPDQDVAALDAELAALDRQILAAKQDMQDMRELTLALAGELEQFKGAAHEAERTGSVKGMESSPEQAGDTASADCSSSDGTTASGSK